MKHSVRADLTKQMHDQLRFVCNMDDVSAAQLVVSGLRIVLRRRLRYKGVDAARLSAIAVRRPGVRKA